MEVSPRFRRVFVSVTVSLSYNRVCCSPFILSTDSTYRLTSLPSQTQTFDNLLELSKELPAEMVRRSKDGAPALEEQPGGGHIVVTAQQSRYALDAVDAPTSKEV
jgi:hypothetical protein